MTTDQLANELRKACERAPKGDKAVTVHLFGIRNADRLTGRQGLGDGD
jgi:hypothetical protein